MVRSAVQVCVRTRPTSNFASDCIQVDPSAKSVCIHQAKEKGSVVNNKQEDWMFKFDHVLHNASQETTYDVVAADIVQSVLEGYNGTILAYGQTGAGKTFTMTGATQNYKYRGIAPRAIAQIFREIQDKPESAVIVRVSYLEIYNETLYDLLADRDAAASEDLQVMDDVKGQVAVKGLTKVVASSEEEALHLLFDGDTNRQIGSHQMNVNSSRSHTVFTVHLEMRSRVDSSEKVITSKLNLVDLAGSERIKKTGSSGVILKEAQHINKSLSFLEQVVMALSDRNREHVPFRQSKLTNVLRDSLGGNCKTRLVANIWAERDELEETISTLKFATRMMKVSTDASVNVVLDPLLLVKKYEREIRDLKQELAMHDALAQREPVSYDPYTAEQQYELQQQVRGYIRGDVEELEVVSVRQVRELFRQFRLIVQNLEHDVARGGGSSSQAAASASSASSSKDQDDGKAAVVSSSSAADNAVGDLDEAGSGLALGVAANNARPPTADGDGGFTSRSKAASSPSAAAAASPSLFSSTASSGMPAIPDEMAAFEEYKQGAGTEVNSAYNDNRAELKKKRTDFRALSLSVNRVKREIDELSAKLDEKRASKPTLPQDSKEDAVVIDEEEFALIRDVKSKKKEYQKVFNDRKICQNELNYLKGLVSQTQVRLCNEFLAWYEQQYHVALSSSSLASISLSLAEQGDADAKEATTISAAAGKFAMTHSSLPAAVRGSVGGGDEDDAQLDDGERFEKLQRERIMSEDPESLSFYAARQEAANKAKKKLGGTMRK